MGKKGSLLFFKNLQWRIPFFGIVTFPIPIQYTKGSNNATGCSDNLLLI